MPTIRTTVDDATYGALVIARKKLGLPSVSAFFLHKSGVLTDRLEAEEIVRRATSAAMKLTDKSRFRLRDLFSTNSWEGFSKGARLRAGRIFFDKMSAARDGIRPDRKSSSGHQFYLKS